MWLDVAGQHVATHQGIAVSAFLKYSNFSFPFSSDFASSQGNFSEISGIPKLKKTPKHPKHTRNISGITVRIQPKLEKESRHVANTDHSRLKGRASANMSTACPHILERDPIDIKYY
jgi:hypothetical protein